MFRLSVVVVLSAGCAGDLLDPGRYTQPDIAFPCDDGADPQMSVLRPRCANGGCHNVGSPAAGLDLYSEDVILRVLAVESRNCRGQVLLEPTPMAPGYLIEKLEQSNPSCGHQMPPGQPLSQRELACLRRWLSHELERVGRGAR